MKKKFWCQCDLTPGRFELVINSSRFLTAGRTSLSKEKSPLSLAMDVLVTESDKEKVVDTRAPKCDKLNILFLQHEREVKDMYE